MRGYRDVSASYRLYPGDIRDVFGGFKWFLRLKGI